MHFIGYDIGSSSIKAAIINGHSLETIAVASHPEKEMKIEAARIGWAEQHPDLWWKHMCTVTQQLLESSSLHASDIKGIGISYQMHGLILVDKDLNVLRPSIIWCDSRAVSIGEQAFSQMGASFCLNHYLNSPGNFTASKLKWVAENEKLLFGKAQKMMLPGDYIIAKMTGEINTTISGLSEGILWDFKEKGLAHDLMQHYGIHEELIPTIVPTFSEQGRLLPVMAAELGLQAGTPVGYRAGDQPNNALSLGVLEPGQVAGTGGTSGVIYGIQEKPNFDSQSRVNSFAHVNYAKEKERIGVLLCVNGAGIQYSWIKQHMNSKNMSFAQMSDTASSIPVGSEGLSILPFGNGAERILGNKDIGSHYSGIRLNRHHTDHFYRASLEGIAFAFVYGAEIMKAMGIEIDTLKVGNDNLFQSEVFSQSVSNLLDCKIEIIQTTGAIGAARAAGFGLKHFNSLEESIHGQKAVQIINPEDNKEPFHLAYNNWLGRLEQILNNTKKDI